MNPAPTALVLAAVVAAGLAALAAAAAAVLWTRERRRRQRLERELDEARERARTAVDARETFFDLATHELRSPIAAILGYQELLRDGAYGTLEPGAEEPVDRIGRSAQHLLHLIDGVVELSRLRAGEARLDLGPVHLGVLLSAVADSFRTHTSERGIDAAVRMPGTLPTVRSDQDRLVSALDLLVTSAVKHPAGGAMALDVEADDHGATLTIDGAAIAVRSDVDDPAVRLGIRLAVAGRVAELLGGELRLEPADGPVIHRLVFTIRDAPDRPSPGL